MIDKRTKAYRRYRDTMFSGLISITCILAITALIAYINLPVHIPVSPLAESPKVSPAEISLVQAVEAREETPELSTRTKGCIKNHPYVAERINEVIGDDYALDLICRESSYNPTVINPSSGACGLAQALPCSKMKCDLADVDCQLKWIAKYVEGRYGSFEGAIAHHNRVNWY